MSSWHRSDNHAAPAPTIVQQKINDPNLLMLLISSGQIATVSSTSKIMLDKKIEDVSTRICLRHVSTAASSEMTGKIILFTGLVSGVAFTDQQQLTIAEELGQIVLPVEVCSAVEIITHVLRH